jgi:preprotein translocase subunit SecY
LVLFLYINSSILIDLLTALFPSLEKLQSEEGELGRQELNFYKKIGTILFGIIQTVLIFNYLKPYIYDISLLNEFITGIELITGSLLIVRYKYY